MLQNLDIILLTCEALDISILYNITSYKNTKEKYDFPFINSMDIFQIRHSNQLRLKSSDTRQVPFDIVTHLVLVLKYSITQEVVINLITQLLVESSQHNLKITHKFYKRFTFLFRRYMDDNTIGLANYLDSRYLNDIATTNLYVLYLLSQSNGYEYLCSYLADFNILNIIKK